MASGWLSPWAFYDEATGKFIIKSDDPLVPRFEFPNVSGKVLLATSLGTQYFVKPGSGDDTKDGLSWDNALDTVAQALTLAGNYAVINIGYGDINEEGLTITQTGLKLIGLGATGLSRVSPVFIGTTDTILTIRADDVEIAGLGFVQTAAFPAIMVADDTGAVNAWRPYIHDCYFDGYGTATNLIDLGESTYEAVAAIIRRCKFISAATSCIRNNSENTQITDNVFNVSAATVGIVDVPDGTNRTDRYYLRNKFLTADAVAAIGISVTNTPDPGMVMIDDNHFVGFGANLSCDVEGSGKTGLMGLNYNGITALAVS